jgi:hypothetical protein
MTPKRQAGSGYAHDRIGSPSIQGTGGRDAWLGIPLSDSEQEIFQALDYNTQDNMGRNAEKDRCPLLPDLSSTPHVRHSSQCRWRLRSFHHPHATAGGRRGLQAIQPSQTERDARSACQTRPTRERTRWEFYYAKAELRGSITVLLRFEPSDRV